MIPSHRYFFPLDFAGCVGIIKWEIQELLASGDGQQAWAEEIFGILSQSKRRQGGETTTGACVQWREKDVSRLHMVEFVSIRTKSL